MPKGNRVEVIQRQDQEDEYTKHRNVGEVWRTEDALVETGKLAGRGTERCPAWACHTCFWQRWRHDRQSAKEKTSGKTGRTHEDKKVRFILDMFGNDQKRRIGVREIEQERGWSPLDDHTPMEEVLAGSEGMVLRSLALQRLRVEYKRSGKVCVRSR